MAAVLVKGKKRCSPNPPSMKCWNEQRAIYGRLSKRLLQVVFSLEPDRESEEVVWRVVFKRGKGTRQVFFLVFLALLPKQRKGKWPSCGTLAPACTALFDEPSN